MRCPFKILAAIWLTAATLCGVPKATADEDATPKFVAGDEVEVKREGNRGYILVYTPTDYTADRAWPIIFDFHGHNGKPTTWPFKQSTGGNGFIIVGMDYKEKAFHDKFDYSLLGSEINNLLEVSRLVRQQLNVDTSMIFIGGFSQGGYTTSQIADKLTAPVNGFLILGAGRPGSSGSPDRRAILRKPFFIAAGENDKENLPNAKTAAAFYQQLGADVTYEEWKGLGHAVNAESEAMRQWLKDNGPLRKVRALIAEAQAAEKSKKAGQAYTIYQQAAAFSATEEICQQAAAAAGKIAEAAEAGFAEVEQLISGGEKDKAFKKLLLLKRQFAGSEFADKATEQLKALNNG